MLRLDALASLIVTSAALVALAGTAGCTSTARQPPGAPPTPTTVTHENPGGDASDPHEAALERQLNLRWGFQEDKDGQLRVPLVDWKNYERVRYWVFDHFVGFKYGTDYHVLNAVVIQDVPEGTPVDPHSCMQMLEKWSFPQFKSFEVKFGESEYTESRWRDHDIMVKSIDGYVDFGLERRRFSAAYAAYDAYPDACLGFGIAVPWRDQKELAQKVRDRWVKEGVSLLRPLTTIRPLRK